MIELLTDPFQEITRNIQYFLWQIPPVKDIIRFCLADAGYSFGNAIVDLLYGLCVAVSYYLAARVAIRKLCWWRIFRKSGRSGWLCLIPFVSSFLEYRICWSGAVYIFTLLATFISCFATAWILSHGLLFLGSGLGQGDLSLSAIGSGMLIAGFLLLMLPLLVRLLELVKTYRLGRRFGRSGWFGLGLIFLHTLFMLILAFGSSEYCPDSRTVKEHPKTNPAKKRHKTNTAIPPAAAPSSPPKSATPIAPVQNHAAAAPIAPVQKQAAAAPVAPVQKQAAAAPIAPAQKQAAAAPIAPVQNHAAAAPIAPAQRHTAAAPAASVSDAPAARRRRNPQPVPSDLAFTPAGLAAPEPVAVPAPVPDPAAAEPASAPVRRRRRPALQNEQ